MVFQHSCLLICLVAASSASAQDNPNLQDALSRGTILPFDAPDFKKILEYVLKGSADRFHNVEGARIENRRREYYFEARVYLPGATYCQILRNKNWFVYNCEWNKASGPGGFP